MRLVERSRGGGSVTLTEAGERLLEHSQEILIRMRAAQADLTALAEGLTSAVRVGVYQSVATQLLPRILPAYRRTWPGAKVLTTEAASDATLFEPVRDGTLDLAFAELPLEPGPFAFRRLLCDPFVLAVPRGSALARLQRPPTWHEITRLPLIGHRTTRFLPQVELQMRAQGAEPRFIHRSDINTTVQAMVGFTGAAAVLTRLMADADDPRAELIELGHLLPPRVIALIWHRDRELVHAAAGFCEIAVEVCRRSTGGARGAHQQPAVRTGEPAA